MPQFVSRSLTAAALILTCFTARAASQAADATTGPRVLLEINPDAQFRRNSEGDLLALKDGSIALVYTRFSGGDDDHSSADLVLRQSLDNGETWTPDRIVVTNEGACNVMSVSLLRLKSGEISLFYLRKDAVGSSCQVLMRRSSDELKTLSAPIAVSSVKGYHVMNNARVLETSSGRLIAPANLHAAVLDEQTSIPYSSHAIPLVYYSDDSGKTWQRDHTELKAPDPKGPVLQENGVVELKDGTLWMYMRSNRGSQFGSSSKDGGLTWSTPMPTVLKSPLSPAIIRRMPWNGDLLCIWNDHSGLHPFLKGKRTPLCAATSHDDGKTWTTSKVIEGNPDGWYCYTSILFQENRALIAYCGGDKLVGGLNRLKVTALPKEWLLGKAD